VRDRYEAGDQRQVVDHDDIWPGILMGVGKSAVPKLGLKV